MALAVVAAMTHIDLAALATVTGGISKAYVDGFGKAFDQASSWCPPANTNAGWNCRMAAGNGGGLAARDRARSR